MAASAIEILGRREGRFILATPDCSLESQLDAGNCDKPGEVYAERFLISALSEPVR